MKSIIAQLIANASGLDSASVKLTYSQNPNFGHISCLNFINYPAKELKTIVARIAKQPIIKNARVDKGYLNIFLTDEFIEAQIRQIAGKKRHYNYKTIGQGKRVNVEFISANPTGPLTIGNGRGGFIGDTIANLLSFVGYEVAREYYINDRGKQIEDLGKSIANIKGAPYQGNYLEKFRRQLASVTKSDFQALGQEGARLILDQCIKRVVKEKLGIKFDIWFSESSLYPQAVNQALERLTKMGLVYEKAGAIYFKSSKFGDDKDRVIKRENGEYTYLASDFAYTADKRKRKFSRLVFLFGADHHGYLNRIKATAQIAGFNPEDVQVIIVQLVRLIQGDRDLRVSKRKGLFVTLEDLVDRVGLDVARFFFLARQPNTHMKFDIKLARERSVKNPVYYIQYAFARASNIIKKARVKPSSDKLISADSLFLKSSSARLLGLKIIQFSDLTSELADSLAVYSLTAYAKELAQLFHNFYEQESVIGDSQELAKLNLVVAFRKHLKRCLALMGISAPEKM